MYSELRNSDENSNYLISLQVGGEVLVAPREGTSSTNGIITDNTPFFMMHVY